MITPLLATFLVSAILAIKELLTLNTTKLRTNNICHVLRISPTIFLSNCIFTETTSALSSWNHAYDLTRDQLNSYIDLNRRCRASKEVAIDKNMISQLSKYTAGLTERAVTTFCNESRNQGLKVK